MLDSIKLRFDNLEKRRLTLVERVRAMSETEQQSPPRPNSFTPAEVIKHFAMIESFNAAFLDKNPPRTLSGQKTALRFFGNFAMNGMKDTVKGVSSLPQATPKGEVDLEAAAAEWEAVRVKLRSYFEQVTDADAAFIKMMWLFGTLSANMYLDLMETHTHYHEVRLERV